MDRFFKIIAALLSLFVLSEVNYPLLTPQSQLAIFAFLGIAVIFLRSPADKTWQRVANWSLVGISAICFLYIFVHSEPFFRSYWLDGQSLGNRAGSEQWPDYWIGGFGLLIVLEATRRSIGLTLPLLAVTFLLYAMLGPYLPGWLFPHRGYPLDRVIGQTFLHSQGVFGIALNVMFTYVFLFVLFGTVLEKTGATGYVINFARNLFKGSQGAPAKIAVLSSGMMGSLSGSAVANTATTGTFTIPLMRSSGFKPEVAAGVEAAASSGGALVPPIMGAGAYMMLEIIEPAVTYLDIIKAALVPAILYYIALFAVVDLQARAAKARAVPVDIAVEKTHRIQGLIFYISFAVLIFLLILGYTPFRAVSIAMLATIFLSYFSQETRLRFSDLTGAMSRAADGGVSLIAASSCVGIIIGVVTLTGVGSKLPGAILPLAQNNLILALCLLMVSTIVLGMGLPSAVCYLLMATLVGPVLDSMGVVPLAAHLFIFYFGMMSMVTPPVALAAYTAAAIAESNIMKSSVAAFRFALIGFALPFAFVRKPSLLLLAPDGGPADFFTAFLEISLTIVAIVPLAAGVTGFLFSRLSVLFRLILTGCALTAMLSTQSTGGNILQMAALLAAAVFCLLNYREGKMK
jgi:TRAP transporter 4TM/12TM fusion protein